MNHISSGQPSGSPLADEIRKRIPGSSLKVTFSRSSGPGGQNVNKVSTRVELAFDLERSGFNAAQRRVIREALAGRIDPSGCVRVASSQHRTQAANRKAAIEKLVKLIQAALRPRKKRRKTVVPMGAIERRLRQKRAVSKRKALRRSREMD